MDKKGFEIDLALRQTMVTNCINKAIWILKTTWLSIEKLYYNFKLYFNFVTQGLRIDGGSGKFWVNHSAKILDTNPPIGQYDQNPPVIENLEKKSSRRVLIVLSYSPYLFKTRFEPFYLIKTKLIELQFNQFFLLIIWFNPCNK